MSERSPVAIASREGELISLRIGVEADSLEALLESLAELPFDINPQIFHHLPGRQDTAVEFPGYDSWITAIRRALTNSGFPAGSLQVRPILDRIPPH
jgi:hypothetical protein